MSASISGKSNTSPCKVKIPIISSPNLCKHAQPKFQMDCLSYNDCSSLNDCSSNQSKSVFSRHLTQDCQLLSPCLSQVLEGQESALLQTQKQVLHVLAVNKSGFTETNRGRAMCFRTHTKRMGWNLIFKCFPFPILQKSY